MKTPSTEPNQEKERFHLLQRLSNELNDWSNEIPDERIIEDLQYKVRTSWFQGASSLIRYIFAINLINDTAFQNEVEAFIVNFRQRRVEALEAMERGEKPESFVPTTKEEIDTVDGFLRKCIESLHISI